MGALILLEEGIRDVGWGGAGEEEEGGWEEDWRFICRINGKKFLNKKRNKKEFHNFWYNGD